MKFDTYLTKLMHTTTDSVFYKNYVLYYVNILHHIDHDLVAHNNKIERMKSLLHMKCRNFISGLQIPANNKIPESIIHVDVLSNILHCISQYLLKENMYTLLYGSVVIQYYDMRIIKSSIINNIFYITISLPSNTEKLLLCHYVVFILITCQGTCQTIRKQVQLILKLKSAIHLFY